MCLKEPQEEQHLLHRGLTCLKQLTHPNLQSPHAPHHGLCFRRLWKNFGRFLEPDRHHHRARTILINNRPLSAKEHADEIEIIQKKMSELNKKMMEL